MLDLSNLNRVLRSENEISEVLTHRIFDSIDRSIVMLEVDFRKKKFVIEKSFQNNYMGNEELKKAAKELDTENKVKKHLGLMK